VMGDAVSWFGTNAIPDTLYAKSGDVHIAYQMIGASNALDLVTIGGDPRVAKRQRLDRRLGDRARRSRRA